MSLPAQAIEIGQLIDVARRQLADAGVAGLSADGSFEHAYAGALTAATIVIRAHDERIHGADHHRLTFDRVGELADARWADVARYFQHCRRRRNTSMYDRSGVVSAAEARELREQAGSFLDEVLAWLRQQRPNLLS